MYPLRAAPDEATDREQEQLSITLPHTETALTEAALHEAVRLALSLNARITLLAVRIQPFPEVLNPMRSFPGFEELMALAEAVGLPATVHIVYARDWESACAQCLAQGSLIVIGLRKKWRPTREDRLADWLERAGHKVTRVTV